MCAVRGDVVILVDTREQRPWVFSARVASKRATVPTGADYTIEGFEAEIGIERKSLDDFIGSVCQGKVRFAASLRALATRRWQMLLIEAPLSALLAGWYRSRAKPSAMLGVVASIMSNGIHIVFADDANAAAQLAERWLLKCHARAVEQKLASESTAVVDGVSHAADPH